MIEVDFGVLKSFLKYLNTPNYTRGSDAYLFVISFFGYDFTY